MTTHIASAALTFSNVARTPNVQHDADMAFEEFEARLSQLENEVYLMHPNQQQHALTALYQGL